MKKSAKQMKRRKDWDLVWNSSFRLMHRVHRLLQLYQMDAPQVIIDSEWHLIGESMARFAEVRKKLDKKTCRAWKTLRTTKKK